MGLKYRHDLASDNGKARKVTSSAASDFAQRPKWDAHELFVIEDQGVEGLVLSGGGDLPFDRQMSQEGTDFGSAHILGMPFLTEEDVSSSPSHVGLLSAEGVMAQAHLVAEAIEELFWLGRGCRVCRFNIVGHSLCLHLWHKGLRWICV